MPRALVTGATGLVGSHIVERLQSEGWDVRALVRDASRRQAPRRGAWSATSWLEQRGVELASGSVADLTPFCDAAAGCNVVFHTAAVIASSGGWEEYKTMNVDGTRNAIAAASRASARLVQVSSVAVYGADSRYRADGARTDESTPLAPLPEHAWYARSKRESEQLVMDAHRDGRLWATAVRPSVIYGPRDRHFVPRIGRILNFGFAPRVSGGRNTLSLVHAANVAEGAVRAARCDVAGGKAYNLAHDFDVTSAEFFRLGGEGLGRRVRYVTIPRPLLDSALWIFSRANALLSGGSLGMVSDGAAANFLTRDNPFSSALARKELGWSPPVSHTVGVPEAFRWWKAHR